MRNWPKRRFNLPMLKPLKANNFHPLRMLDEGQAMDARQTYNLAKAAFIMGMDRGTLGGFKRSSQHLDGGSCDGEAEAEIGSVWTGTIAIARPSAGRGPRPTGTVLGGHCCGLVE